MSANSRYVPADPRSTTPRLSMIVPCYNGERFVVGSLKRLDDFLRTNAATLGSYELIFVDDGSTDRTRERVTAAFPHVIVLCHDRNRGKGAAVRTGMLRARGEFLFFIDADVPYDLHALDPMLDYLDRKEFHLCIGSRSRLPDSHPARRNRLRRVASYLFTLFVSRIVVTGVHDTQCGFKGFRRDAARFLFSRTYCNNFAFDVEVLYLAFKSDFDIKKLPVRLCEDDWSSISVLRHGLPMLFETLKVPIRYYAGRYQLPEGRNNEAAGDEWRA